MSNSLKKSFQGEEGNQNNGYNYSQGVTKRLLEKYMPSKGLTVISGGKEEIKRDKAA